MRVRMLCLAIVAAIVVWPAIARADLYINAQGIEVYGKPNNCAWIRKSGDGKFDVFQCSGGGDFTMYPYSNKRTGKCTLRWEGDKHWHATWITKTADCSMYWQNSNTLDVKIPWP